MQHMPQLLVLVGAKAPQNRNCGVLARLLFLIHAINVRGGTSLDNVRYREFVRPSPSSGISATLPTLAREAGLTFLAPPRKVTKEGGS
ncbi:MAG: hypothetical protein LUG55_11210, partial [Clostridiales bacterium]|nr:hypothetical protein [Clostridiales bacterium]